MLVAGIQFFIPVVLGNHDVNFIFLPLIQSISKLRSVEDKELFTKNLNFNLYLLQFVK